MAELARLAGMDAAAVSRQVRSLEERGMATRRAGPGRVVLVEPTPEGRACARRVRAFYDRHLVDVLASWEPDERDALGHLLVRLVDDLERTPYRSS
jgi:DNA-binding MarR family transcriptional regulator